MSIAGSLFRGLGKFIPAGALTALGRPAAVYFHGVENEIADEGLFVNHHRTEAFYEIVKSLKAHFDVLPLAALGDVLKAPSRHKRALFLMSDDGYANLAGEAATILATLDLPWTLFVSTHHIETGERNPLFVARLFFYRAPQGIYTLPHFGAPLMLGDENARGPIAEKALFHLQNLDAGKGREVLAAIESHLEAAGLGALATGFASETFLNWDELRALHAKGVEIGAHAHWHWAMNGAQSGAYLAEQARLPKERIEKMIGPCRYFAYPFGNTNDVSGAAWRAVRDAGYEYAFTTLSGTLDASTNPFLLPRYGIGLDETHVAGLIPLLWAGNQRLVHWQKGLAANSAA